MDTSILENNAPIPMYAHTCVTCRVVFARSDLHRDHFKSDWHRYNLKRKMADLPTVTAETFQKKVLEMKPASEPIEEQESRRCSCCNKTYQSEAAFENHCKSKKHLEVAQKQQQDGEKIEKDAKPEPVNTGAPTNSDEQIEDRIDDEDNESAVMGEAPVRVDCCLFCSHSSDGMDENLKHMSTKHGFFLVDLEYCVDLEGLMAYLGSKVGEGFCCLWCNERGRQFRTLDAVQKHMRDKCHCKMYHDGEAMLEYSEFYDYSPSYPDHDNVKDSAELDADIDLPILEDQGYELVLPSGATIGHRSLMRYYKQNLRPVKDIVPAKRQAVHRLLNEYRSIGWTGTSGESAVRKARDLKFVQKIQAKRRMQIGVKGNRLQKHFRSQIDF